MKAKPLIWFVDDDAEMRKLLDEYLTQSGYEVRSFANAADVEKWLTRLRPDLLVLDLMLPGMSGLDLCRRLRATGDDVPIIMLTALSEPMDRALGIEAGADDYVGKPFMPRELTARIEAVLRRRSSLPAGAPLPKGDTVVFGACQLNLATRSLLRDGREVEMTSGEFALLAALVQHPNQPLSRERLRELARGRNSESDERSIDVQISRLRKMVEPSSGRPCHIQTVWGFGYVFVPEASAEAP
ncbi:MAG: response regulator [Thiobacillaceae bacterium]|jgi:two-component system, OmpR family, phosphate regulon response regulator OmpR